jgi:uncharacterized membrane protein YqhA
MHGHYPWDTALGQTYYTRRREMMRRILSGTR